MRSTFVIYSCVDPVLLVYLKKIRLHGQQGRNAIFAGRRVDRRGLQMYLQKGFGPHVEQRLFLETVIGKILDKSAFRNPDNVCRIYLIGLRGDKGNSR